MCLYSSQNFRFLTRDIGQACIEPLNRDFTVNVLVRPGVLVDVKNWVDYGIENRNVIRQLDSCGVVKVKFFENHNVRVFEKLGFGYVESEFRGH